jgi:hypothetical protein
VTEPSSLALITTVKSFTLQCHNVSLDQSVGDEPSSLLSIWRKKVTLQALDFYFCALSLQFRQLKVNYLAGFRQTNYDFLTIIIWVYGWLSKIVILLFSLALRRELKKDRNIFVRIFANSSVGANAIKQFYWKTYFAWLK